jgi:hypothetical protein
MGWEVLSGVETAVRQRAEVTFRWGSGGRCEGAGEFGDSEERVNGLLERRLMQRGSE